jgi:diguanylate cyclase (GGDEF)-like protein/PAS domain S-box-containing protein
VWRATSRAALLAPMLEARRSTLHLAVITSIGLAALLALYLAWQLQPLHALERRAEGLLKGDESDVWPEASGEIGSLARTLRHVWAERTQADRFNVHIMQKLSSVMGASPVGLAFLRHGHFELFSAECCRLLGYQEQDLVGQPAATIFEDEQDFKRLQEAARASFDTGANYEGEWRLRTASGSSFWARIRSRPVVAGERDAGSIWSLYNIDEQIESRQRLEHAALHDPLTGLFNRKGMAGRLAEAFAHRDDGTPASLVLLDLDHFKPVNDRGGHAAGDAMLKLVAQTLARCVRASDSVARVGGDEFAILLPGCPAAQAQAVLEKVQAGIHAIQLPWEQHTFGIGASLGLAELGPAHVDIDTWLADADRACYEAKRAGRGAIRAASALHGASSHHTLEALDAGI